MLRLGKTNTTKLKTNEKKKKRTPTREKKKKTPFFFFSWRRQRKREGGRERERRNSAKCSCTSGFQRPLQYRQGVTQLLNISWEMWSKDCPHPCSSLFQPCGHWCAKWPAPPCVPLSPQLTQLPDVSVLVIPPPKAKQVPLPLLLEVVVLCHHPMDSGARESTAGTHFALGGWSVLLRPPPSVTMVAMP